MKILTNPFEICSEKRLLLVGLLATLIAAWISTCSSTLIFGSLKVINNYHQSYGQALINLAITLVSNSVILFAFARIRYPKTRLIDVFSVVFTAHIIIYILLGLTAIPIVQESVRAVELEILDKGFQMPELEKIHQFTLGAIGVLSISLIIYFFYLLVVGMKIAMNSKSKWESVVLILLVFVWNTCLQFLNLYV